MDKIEQIMSKQEQTEKIVQKNRTRQKLLFSSLDYGSKLINSSLGRTTASIYPPSNYTSMVLRESYFS